jgi:hypothetical protein
LLVLLVILAEQERFPMARKSCTSSPDLFTSFLAAPPKSEVLERPATLIDWERLRSLLERLYQLSDRDAVWVARDSLSFRQFLGLGAGDNVPDDKGIHAPSGGPLIRQPYSAIHRDKQDGGDARDG